MSIDERLIEIIKPYNEQIISIVQSHILRGADENLMRENIKIFIPYLIPAIKKAVIEALPKEKKSKEYNKCLKQVNDIILGK